MDLTTYVNNLNNMSGEQLYKKIKSLYGGMGGFSLAYNKALNNYTGSDKDKIRNIISTIESKVGEYLKQQQQQMAQQQKANNQQQNITDGLQTSVSVKRPRLPNEPSDFDIGYNSGFNSGVNALLSKVNDALSNYYKALDNMGVNISNIKSYTDVLNSKIQTTQQLLNTKSNIWDNTFKQLQGNLNQLKQQYGQTYGNILDRINKYESDMDKTFSSMKNRLNQIGQNYEKVLQFNQSAAASAAEKQLRGATGKASQLRVANYLSNLNQKGAADLAKLQAQLAEQANTLDQQYLALKKQIMNDKNLTDEKKSAILDNINQRQAQLVTQLGNIKTAMADEATQPIKEGIARQEQIVNTIDNAKIQQQIQKLNYEWQTKPENRDIILNKIISNIGIPIPNSIYNALKNYNDFNKALNYLNRYVVNYKMSLQNRQTVNTNPNVNNYRQQTSNYNINDAYSEYRTKYANNPKAAIVASIIKDMMLNNGKLPNTGAAIKYPELAKIAQQYYDRINKKQ